MNAQGPSPNTTPTSSQAAPSAWIQRFTPLLPAGARVLDVACGSGRHMRWLKAQGFVPLGLDRDAQALAAAAAFGEVLQADLENAPWPLPGQQFGAVVVTHYLWRPLLPEVLAAVQPGGVLLYETFGQGQASLGRPSRPEFLLRPGELLSLCPAPDWHVVAFEDGFESRPARYVQRIAAVRLAPPAEPAPDVRYPLGG